MDNWQRLLDHARRLPSGEVIGVPTLEDLLAACWGDIEGSDAESMTAEKLVGRIEKLEWNPPVISFIIERHGAWVMGSTRSALHRWSINLDTKTADCNACYSYRQKASRDKPFRAKEAKETAENMIAAMEEGRDDPRLKWLVGRIDVKVILSRSIPESYKQTAPGRTRRLLEELVRLASAYGWKLIDGKGTRFKKSAPCVKPPETPDH